MPAAKSSTQARTVHTDWYPPDNNAPTGHYVSGVSDLLKCPYRSSSDMFRSQVVVTCDALCLFVSPPCLFLPLHRVLGGTVDAGTPTQRRDRELNRQARLGGLVIFPLDPCRGNVPGKTIGRVRPCRIDMPAAKSSSQTRPRHPDRDPADAHAPSGACDIIRSRSG